MRATNSFALYELGSGDPRVWSELVSLLSPQLYAWIRPYAADGAEAADVAQETWLSLWENVDRLRNPECIPAWLRTTARRGAARHRVARVREVPLETGFGSREPPASAVGDPEDYALAAEREAVIRRLVRELPVRERLLLALIAEDAEHTSAQLAGLLGLSPNGASSFRARCFARLRRRLLAVGITPE